MAPPLPKPKALLADKGYDRYKFREDLLMQHSAGRPAAFEL
jgi:hypothetical protein